MPKSMANASFVVVANRLPVNRVTDEKGQASWQTAPGGLVTALEPLMRQTGGAWVGWIGAPDETVKPFRHEGYDIVPVELSAEEITRYYEGFSNATLWPLYHDAVAFPEFHREWWESYQKVNHRFAKVTAEVAAPGATVWIQDYQLQLVPQMLRELRPDLKIGFFLHIPFPPVELFEQIPWRTQLINGLLGADLVGFQTPGGAKNFLRLVRKRTEHRVERNHVVLSGSHTCTARAFPISIDVEGFHALAQSDSVKDESEELLEQLGHPKTIILGVDRLDYTKGIKQRIQAVGELFESGELDPEETVFLQVATPSREDVEQYRVLRDEIDLMVGRINSSVGGVGRPAISYRHAGFPRATMAAMYRIASVMLVTPLRDGMNLVAKEYIACHPGRSGALVLSEFAGAARELKRAYLVNPYDLDGLKATIMQAINDPYAERSKRWRAMQRQVWNNTVQDWATNFLAQLEETSKPDQSAEHEA